MTPLMMIFEVLTEIVLRLKCRHIFLGDIPQVH